MKRNPGLGLVLDSGRESLISSAGALLPLGVRRLIGLDQALSAGLAPWAGRRRHDPAKVVLDVATAVALGGDCLADVAALRAQPGLFGAVASDPTVSRVIASLAADEATTDAAVTAIRQARAAARSAVWARRRPLAGVAGTRQGGQVILDIDATLVTAHSEKQNAAPTYKHGFGFSPMCAFVDHGAHGTGETLVVQLRPGNSSAFSGPDHIKVLTIALAQLPEAERGQVLVRTDAGGCSKAFLGHVTDLGLEYSIGFPNRDGVQAAIATIPDDAWVQALDGDGEPRQDAQIADLTDWIPTPTTPTRSPVRHGPQDWPPTMRVIARREIPHPGAQLRLTDHNGWRVTCFATNTPTTTAGTTVGNSDDPHGWDLADLEIRHRQRARAEDRIRALKDTGLRNLPFHGYHQNRIWVEIVALAADLLTWTQTLAFDHNEPARRWEPKKIRYRILAVAARIIHTGRRRKLRLPNGWPWNHLIETGWAALHT